MKLGLYFGAWAVLIFQLLRDKPEQLLKAPGFPIGLLAGLPAQTAIVVAWFGGWLVAIVGWTIYGVLTNVILRARRMPVFAITYVVFCVLLALNMVGCNKMIEIAAGIH